MAERRTFPVTATGVGRKDYSANVEYSVMPLIRSWQSKYVYSELITVPAGAEVTQLITIVTGTVIIVYDVAISAPKNALLRLMVDLWSPLFGGVWNMVLVKLGYQKVDISLRDGFPFFAQYRVKIRNYGSDDLVVPLNISGIVTDETDYWGGG
jgi:hypothetical protein